ncbi:MAG: hypothetical protein MO852_10440 [Candidatus Devosia euplotis]|nr:hypothetical protein [Candidatus Devosia euplotis]
MPFAAACGLIVAVCGILTGGAAFGASAEQAKAILAGEEVTGLFCPLKLIAAMVTAISGIPGAYSRRRYRLGRGWPRCCRVRWAFPSARWR